MKKVNSKAKQGVKFSGEKLYVSAEQIGDDGEFITTCSEALVKEELQVGEVYIEFTPTRVVDVVASVREMKG